MRLIFLIFCTIFSAIFCTSYLAAFATVRPQAPPATNPGTVTITDPSLFSQVVVMSDVHGMFDPLVTLLRAGNIIDEQKHWSAKNTLFVVVGDSIDKGPQSIEVLDLWIQLSAEAEKVGGQVIHTLGNHEAEFLAQPDDDQKSTELYAELKSKNIPITDLTDRAKPRGLFLKNEPAALAVGKWLFFHAGDFPLEHWSDFQGQALALLSAEKYGDNFFIGSGSFLESKGWWKKKSSREVVERNFINEGFFGIVFGHQPRAFGVQGRSAAIDDGHLIKIDNGMAPEAGSNSGSLLIFAHPTEMKENVFPHIQVVLSDGTKHRVDIELVTDSPGSD